METFPIAQGAGRTMWVLFGLGFIVMATVTVVLFLSARGARASRFTVAEDGLRLQGDLYGRRIPAGELRTSEARLVNLRETRDLQPSWRKLGTALPGYRSGWFKLRNGERALLYLTDDTRAVYVPTTKGYSLLLSPQEPERFLERLRALPR